MHNTYLLVIAQKYYVFLYNKYLAKHSNYFFSTLATMKTRNSFDIIQYFKFTSLYLIYLKYYLQYLQ